MMGVVRATGHTSCEMSEFDGVMELLRFRNQTQECGTTIAQQSPVRQSYVEHCEAQQLRRAGLQMSASRVQSGTDPFGMYVARPNGNQLHDGTYRHDF